MPASQTKDSSSVQQVSIQALTVGAVVSRIKVSVEGAFPSSVWIEGELSNCVYHGSGHIYFSLVDEQATDRFGQRLVLPCAFFRGFNKDLKFKLTDGTKVLCMGQVTTYEGRGQYQLKVMRVEPKGIGALQLAFDQMKKKLQAEGLFDPKRKRAIPKIPDRVGILTSRTGSAVHDMVSKLRGWFNVIVMPVKVQGEGSVDEIVQMLNLANKRKVADVLILGRGGGSVEDLWTFNEEAVARAIAASRIPIITAVGHQDDWTIADFVADQRASTPTDAAKLLVYEQEVFAETARDLIQQLVDNMQMVVDEAMQRVRELAAQLRLLHPINQLERYVARTSELTGQLVQSMRIIINQGEQRLQALAGQLQALSPLAVLSRGYSITLKQKNKRVVRTTNDVSIGDEIETMLAGGSLVSRVSERKPG